MELPLLNRFSKLFHCQNQEKICNNTVTKDPTHTHLKCVSRLPCEMSVYISLATTENKTTSVTTYFMKLTTGNMHVYCLSYCLN